MKPEHETDSTFAEDAILCRGISELPDVADCEIMFMPGGRQSITPYRGGIGKPMDVLVDRAGAAAMEAQRTALLAKGKRAYFDFEHQDSGASFWPAAFFWKEGARPGIYAKGEWTADGKAGVEGKTWRCFSPVFRVDRKDATPARLRCEPGAEPNMGGLVNDNAFTNISPLWAKNAGGAQSTDSTQQHMNEQQLAALQAKNTELENEIAGLKAERAAIKAKNENDEFVSARIEAKELQLKLNNSELANAALKAKADTAETAIKARNKGDAEKAVADAIARGAIAAKDEASVKFWTDTITNDPAQSAILAKMGGNPALGGRITTSHAQVTAEAPNNVIRAFGAICAKNAAIPLSAATAEEKALLAHEAGRMFTTEIKGKFDPLGMSLNDAIKAADYSDAAGNVGLLSGTLVLLSALPVLKYSYPVLSAITTDYASTPGMYGQTETTRIVLSPAVQSYNTAADSAGRPTGWDTASPALTTDVSITLNNYKGVPIVFGITTLAATLRDLFGEQSVMAINALGGDMVNALTALMTSANFNAYAGLTAASGATTSGSTAISAASTANMYPGMKITGTGIPANTLIASVTDGTNAVLTKKATATNTGLTFTLQSSDQIPTAYATYAVAQASFSTADLGNIKAIFDPNKVPEQGRTILLNSLFYNQLTRDQIFHFYAAMKQPEIITAGQLPPINGFVPMNAPYFPSANYGFGFAMHNAALAIKSRLPQGLPQNLSAQPPGQISTITDPDTGLSFNLVQYWNLQGGYYEWRPELMYGVALGDRRCGLLLTSQ